MVKKGEFPCEICLEAKDAWDNGGAFMNVFGTIYSKKQFGDKASIGFTQQS